MGVNTNATTDLPGVNIAGSEPENIDVFDGFPTSSVLYTSTSFVDITNGLTGLNFNCDGGTYLILFQATEFLNSGTGRFQYRLDFDSGNIISPTGWQHRQDETFRHETSTFFGTVTLAAGAHTVDVQGRISTGTAQIRIDANDAYKISLVKIIAEPLLDHVCVYDGPAYSGGGSGTDSASATYVAIDAANLNSTSFSVAGGTYMVLFDTSQFQLTASCKVRYRLNIDAGSTLVEPASWQHFMNNGTGHEAKTNTGTVSLTPGNHTVTAEFRRESGTGTVRIDANDPVKLILIRVGV